VFAAAVLSVYLKSAKINALIHASAVLLHDLAHALTCSIINIIYFAASALVHHLKLVPGIPVHVGLVCQVCKMRHPGHVAVFIISVTCSGAAHGRGT
jgi:hypothetical protein